MPRTAGAANPGERALARITGRPEDPVLAVVVLSRAMHDATAPRRLRRAGVAQGLAILDTSSSNGRRLAVTADALVGGNGANLAPIRKACASGQSA